ncbi:MAG: glycine zipper 2TM domain-containing protein [Hyphomonadaceae bacterium]|nr:glycine zipper 2TM domain-containing protein [Hyphomonadaceae bacterium]MBP9234931.1 glycine zipper 2TM domain-containing protein [Hyphomonadaceae bacterium]
MSAIKTAFCAAVASLSLAACSTTDSWDPSQRNAAIGGALGAAAGAAIADDDLSGALIGGALGAAVGYYTGCQEQGGCFVGGKQVAGRDDLVYDNQARRYYYVDRGTGRTYWESGEFRG